MSRRLAQKMPQININVLSVNIAVLFLIFSSALLSYINSSFLIQFISDEAIGMIFALSAALTILLFLFISRILRTLGNYKATIGFIIADFLCLIGLATAESMRTAVPLFIAHQTLITTIFFNFDIFMEEAIGKTEGSTGARRGLLLATSSFVGAITPLVTGYAVDTSGSFSLVYYLSAMTLIPILALVVFRFKRINTKEQCELKVLDAMRSFWIERDIRFVFLANLLLWVFFCLATVYAPLYMATELEYSWKQIGIILFGAQLAYTFFEYPIGKIADAYIGEREMMAAGFTILSVSTAILAFLPGGVIWTWIIAMFITRTGASLIEVTTDSYFFKHTKGTDAQVISFYRMAGPLAYIGAPLIASLAFLYIPFNLIFVVFALLVLPGVLFATTIRDTK